MSDFLDELERELIGAAHRRSQSPRRVTDPARRRWQASRADLHALGSGAMTVASMAAVVAVAAMFIAAGRYTTSVRGGDTTGGRSPASPVARHCRVTVLSPGVSASAPAADVRWLLSAGEPAGAAVRRLAVRDLDQTTSRATTVYARYITTVTLPGSGRVILIPARTCRSHAAGSSARPQVSLLAEVRSGGAVDTIRLGTAHQIRSGAAFRSVDAFVSEDRRSRLVSMVPSDVISVICRRVGSRTGARRYAVVDHLIVMPRPASGVDCDLVRD